jgi:hypothetical protein
VGFLPGRKLLDIFKALPEEAVRHAGAARQRPLRKARR